MDQNMKDSILFILGAVFGWVISEILRGVFKDKFERFGRSVFRRCISKKIIKSGEYHKIGDYMTRLFVIDGNGNYKYNTNTIDARYHDGTPDSPDDISDRILEKEREMEARKAAGSAKAWDGIGVGVKSYSILRDDKEENLAISIDFYKSRYTQFQATVATIGREDRSLPDAIFNKHLRGKNPRDLVPYLARHVGIAVLVITSDKILILTQRDNNTGARPGEFDVSVVEGIEPTKDADTSGPINKIDVFKSIVRGCDEELGFRPSSDEISILGFGVDMEFYQYNFLALVKTRLTYDEIDSNRNGRAKDGWETRINPIVYDIDTVLNIINTEKMWGFSSTLLHWSLFSEFSKHVIDARAKQIVLRRDSYNH